jgi:hypothetical protein
MAKLILSTRWLSRGVEALLARVEASHALIASRQCRDSTSTLRKPVAYRPQTSRGL